MQFNLDMKVNSSKVEMKQEKERNFRPLIAQDLGNAWSGRTSVTPLVPIYGTASTLPV